MPARVAPLKQTYVPLGQKAGGQFSNATSHDSPPNTLTTVNDLFIVGGQWVPRFGNAAFGPTLSSQALSMSVYNRYSGVGLPVSHLMVSISGSVVDQSSVSTTTIRSGLSSRRMIFNSVKNRCFMANGVDAPFIWDGTTTSTWGVSAPTANLLYSATPPGYNTGTISINGGPSGVTSVNLTFAGTGYSGVPAIGFTGGGGSGAAATAVIDLPSGTVTKINITAQGSGYTSPPVVTFTGGTSGNIAAATAIVTTLGSTQVTGVGTNFVHSPTFVGQPMYILGTRYIISNVTDATHLILSTPYIGVNFASLAAPNWKINTGLMSWDAGNGFRYAYSYWDPVTGHTGNIGPILSVDDAAPNNDFSSIVVSNIVTTGDARFTKIILWRTAHGGGVLFPLAILNNTGGPLSYTDNDNDDTDLGTVGPGSLPAPIVTNAPAPTDLDDVSYWDGRFWGSRTSQPGLLYFSSKNDPNELPIGVGEECWPAPYNIPISEDNGRITGTRAVGSTLYCLTEKSLFVVLGNAPANYTVVRVSSKGRGADQLSACTLPGEDNNSGDILVHFGNDSRMYFLYGPGGDVSMTYPIQDKL